MTFSGIGSASGQVFASGPIQIVVPYTPGTVSDAVARFLASELNKQLGQTIVVENRAGDGGTVAIKYVARSEPTGRLLLLATYQMQLRPYKADLAPVGMVAKGPMVLVTNRSGPVQSPKDLVARAKSGSAAMAAFGVGSRLVLAKFEVAAGAKFNRVDNVTTLQSIAAGQFDGAFLPSGAAMDLMRGGIVKALGIASPARSRLLPDVPTLAEQGFANVVYEQWIGLLAPARSPPEAISRLNGALMVVLRSSDMSENLAKFGLVPSPSTPDGFVTAVNATAGIPVCGTPCPSDCKDGCPEGGDCCVAAY